MSLTIETKKAIVTELADVAANASSAIAADYSGLTVAQMTVLRKQASAAGIYLKVVRNTLSRRAVKDTDFECLSDGLKGQLLLAFANEEPGSAARVIQDFAKDNEQLQVKLIALDGKLLDVADLKRLASMPSKDEGRAMLLGLLQAPATKLVRTLAEPGAKFARLLAAKRDQEAA